MEEGGRKKRNGGRGHLTAGRSPAGRQRVQWASWAWPTYTSVTDGETSVQKMSGFRAGRWSNDAQLFWTGGKPGAKLTLTVEVPEIAKYDVAAAFTVARDYGQIQVSLNGTPIGPALDLFNGTDVKTTGLVSLGSHSLRAGSHELTIEITGANEAAVQKFMVGLDFVRFELVK